MDAKGDRNGSKSNGREEIKEVTAAVIISEGRVLIAQRGCGDRLAGKWEFPGGKVEKGETFEECLRREIREEFDANIEVISFLGESLYEYESGRIRLTAFLCRKLSGDFILKVHSSMAWVKRPELDLYDYAPADIPLVEKVKEIL